MICRQSSEPIEPPAPVTMTTRSRMQASNSPGFGGTESRPKRSQTSTSRMSSTVAVPVTSCSNSGTVCTCTPNGSSSLKISRRRRRVNDGSASRMRSILRSLIKAGKFFGRIDLDAIDHSPMQALLVVDEDQWVKGAGGRQGSRKARAGIARAVDGHSSDGRLVIVGEQVVAHARNGNRRRTAMRGRNRWSRRSRRAPVFLAKILRCPTIPRSRKPRRQRQTQLYGRENG